MLIIFRTSTHCLTISTCRGILPIAGWQRRPPDLSSQTHTCASPPLPHDNHFTFTHPCNVHVRQGWDVKDWTTRVFSWWRSLVNIWISLRWAQAGPKICLVSSSKQRRARWHHLNCFHYRLKILALARSLSLSLTHPFPHPTHTHRSFSTLKRFDPLSESLHLLFSIIRIVKADIGSERGQSHRSRPVL